MGSGNMDGWYRYGIGDKDRVADMDRGSDEDMDGVGNVMYFLK